MKAPSESVAEAELAGLRYPLLASFKLDGLRAVGRGRVVVSRTLKPFRNAFLNAQFAGADVEGLDGELAVGDPFGDDLLSRTMSGITSEEGEPDFTWWLFDDFSAPPGHSFQARHFGLARRVAALPRALRARCEVLPHRYCFDHGEVLELEREALGARYEGLMLRDPMGPYKAGRSTRREALLLKLKRFVDGEALVTGVEEASHNTNEGVRQPDGSLRRSTRRAGMALSGAIGVIVGQDLVTGETVRMGTGRMTADERRRYQSVPDLIVGRIAKYRRFPSSTFEAARFPTFQAFRDKSDM
jgi:DNA ligase 1